MIYGLKMDHFISIKGESDPTCLRLLFFIAGNLIFFHLNFSAGNSFKPLTEEGTQKDGENGVTGSGDKSKDEPAARAQDSSSGATPTAETTPTKSKSIFGSKEKKDKSDKDKDKGKMAPGKPKGSSSDGFDCKYRFSAIDSAVSSSVS